MLSDLPETTSMYFCFMAGPTSTCSLQYLDVDRPASIDIRCPAATLTDTNVRKRTAEAPEVKGCPSEVYARNLRWTPYMVVGNESTRQREPQPYLRFHSGYRDPQLHSLQATVNPKLEIVETFSEAFLTTLLSCSCRHSTGRVLCYPNGSKYPNNGSLCSKYYM